MRLYYIRILKYPQNMSRADPKCITISIIYMTHNCYLRDDIDDKSEHCVVHATAQYRDNSGPHGKTHNQVAKVCGASCPISGGKLSSFLFLLLHICRDLGAQ